MPRKPTLKRAYEDRTRAFLGFDDDNGYRYGFGLDSTPNHYVHVFRYVPYNQPPFWALCEEGNKKYPLRGLNYRTVAAHLGWPDGEPHHRYRFCNVCISLLQSIGANDDIDRLAKRLAEVAVVGVDE